MARATSEAGSDLDASSGMEVSHVIIRVINTASSAEEVKVWPK